MEDGEECMVMKRKDIFLESEILYTEILQAIQTRNKIYYVLLLYVPETSSSLS